MTGFGGMTHTPTGTLYLTGKEGVPYSLFAEEEKQKVYRHFELLLSIDATKQQVDLDPRWLSTKTRTPNPGPGTGMYTNVHGDYSFQGDKRKAQKVFRTLLKAGVGQPDYVLVGSPDWRGKTLGQALGEMAQDAVDEVAGKSFGAITLYHGTSKKRWDIIKTKGLRPGSPTGMPPEEYTDYIQGYSNHNVYLTTSQILAENFATRAAVLDRTLAVVLEVTVRDFGKLLLDEDNAGVIGPDDPREPGRIPFHDLAWTKGPNAEAIGRAFQRKMLPGLRKYKTIAYKGIIPTRDLKVSYTYKPVRMSEDPNDREFQEAMGKTHDTLSPARVAARYLL